MQESGFRDYFSAGAGEYARFRPQYPRALIRQISETALGRDLAWDCGTGNGQAALALAAHFKKVIATDPSESQLARASAQPNLEFRRERAEASSLEPQSVDLVTAAQAFHWFQQELFFREVRRVAKPGAILAIWCYGLCTITPAVDAVVRELYGDILGTYWDPARQQVDEGYRQEKIPFFEIEAPRAVMALSWNIADLVGYLGTWSALQSYREQNGSDPRALVIPRLQQAWGDLSGEKSVTWPLSVRMFRILGP